MDRRLSDPGHKNSRNHASFGKWTDWQHLQPSAPSPCSEPDPTPWHVVLANNLKTWHSDGKPINPDSMPIPLSSPCSEPDIRRRPSEVSSKKGLQHNPSFARPMLPGKDSQVDKDKSGLPRRLSERPWHEILADNLSQWNARCQKECELHVESRRGSNLSDPARRQQESEFQSRRRSNLSDPETSSGGGASELRRRNSSHEGTGLDPGLYNRPNETRVSQGKGRRGSAPDTNVEWHPTSWDNPEMIRASQQNGQYARYSYPDTRRSSEVSQPMFPDSRRRSVSGAGDEIRAGTDGYPEAMTKPLDHSRPESPLSAALSSKRGSSHRADSPLSSRRGSYRSESPLSGPCSETDSRQRFSEDPWSPVLSDSGRDKLTRRRTRNEEGSAFLFTFFVGIEDDDRFCVAKRIIGPNGQNLRTIAETAGRGTKVRLRGKGSVRGAHKESDAPLQINISCTQFGAFERAKQLVTDFLNTIYVAYAEANKGSAR